eukprot:TRINITY_DN271_c1_g1_i1.p2 TRINITY_DN271_c1_g1~~TRINITY_DN271_c1_g1_i1.p2  ORF type:complete len:297 (-),score=136.30 TRINITY_DN271_c1_g1_i1:969-1766(-)
MTDPVELHEVDLLASLPEPPIDSSLIENFIRTQLEVNLFAAEKWKAFSERWSSFLGLNISLKDIADSLAIASSDVIGGGKEKKKRIRSRRWTKEEDEHFVSVYVQSNGDVSKVAEEFPERSRAQCKSHLRVLVQKGLLEKIEHTDIEGPSYSALPARSDDDSDDDNEESDDGDSNDDDGDDIVVDGHEIVPVSSSFSKSSPKSDSDSEEENAKKRSRKEMEMEKEKEKEKHKKKHKKHEKHEKHEKRGEKHKKKGEKGEKKRKIM